MRLDHGIPSLILRKLQGAITPEDEALLDTWAAAEPANRALLNRLMDESQVVADTKAFDELWGSEDGVARFDRMEQTVLADTAVPVKGLWRRWLPFTAAAILLVAMGTWVFFNNTTANRQATIAYADNITPGGSRATLTLADGRVIDLSEAKTGIVIEDDAISYNDGASLAAIANYAGQADNIPQLVLNTPRGGEYQITLSDGTKVWLNSSSTLKYPSRFDGSERVVELVGEAYFDVARAEGQQGKRAKKQEWPFRVVSDGQIVEVLGTEFNISAYADEPEVKTTLVEGSVQVTSDADNQPPVTLNPGQQATARGGQIMVNPVDVQLYTAWKDGFFNFNGDSPEEAFAQLGRWYDVEVAYPGKVPTVQFYGKIERSKPLGSILRILEKAGLEFEVVSEGSVPQLVIGHK